MLPVTLLTTFAITLLQQPIPAQTPVVIDFTATAPDGTPVTDLKGQDVAIKIEGKTRRIRNLRLVSVAPVKETIDSSAPPPPFGTNELTRDGRSLVLAIDDDSFRTGREQPLRDAVTGLIAKLTPRDRVLLVTMPYGGVKVPFTTDHARITRAISTLTGQRPKSETGSEMACRTRRVLESIAGFLEVLGFAEGPTSVVFFTGGMAGPRRDAIAIRAPGMCELSVEVFQRVARTASAARANFYVVHPDDMTLALQPAETIAGDGFIGSDNPLEGIEHLTGVTGGRRLPLLTTGTTALARVVRETSAYYEAELDPEPSDRDGRSRPMNIRVNRANLQVSFRPLAAFGAPAAAAEPSREVPVRDMLLTARGFADLPLRAAGFTTVGTEGKVKVVALAEPADPAVKLQAVSAVLVGQDGVVAAQWSAADATEIPVSGAMLVTPGIYRLRVAATDATGRGGAADYEFEARLAPAGPFHVSSLMLGVSRGGMLIPKLQFGAEPVALASLEFTGEATGARLTIGLEVARTTDGPAILSVPLAVERLGDHHYAATGAVAIGALPPGDYVVRGVIGIEGQAPVRVVRTLRKT